MKRRLFADECELRSLGNITLTTRRVIAYARHGAGEASTSLLLDHVQWTRLASERHPSLTMTSTALGALTMMALMGGSLILGSLTLASFLVALVLQAVRRRTALVIASGDGRIKAWLDGDPERHRQARSFLDAVDHAAARDWSALPSGAVAIVDRPRVVESAQEVSFDAR